MDATSLATLWAAIALFIFLGAVIYLKVPGMLAKSLDARAAKISGELEEGCDAIDLLTATFPGGSITGAPKVRAMQIIAELEPSRRGVYCGSIGYIGTSGVMDTSIVIRTYQALDDAVYFSAGGGIVADSDPEQEYRETLDKARALIDALAATGQPAHP